MALVKQFVILLLILSFGYVVAGGLMQGLTAVRSMLVFALITAVAGLLRHLYYAHAWRTLAQHTGLTYQPPGADAPLALLLSNFGTVEGAYRGREVTLRSFTRTTGLRSDRTTFFHPLLTVQVDAAPGSVIRFGIIRPDLGAHPLARLTRFMVGTRGKSDRPKDEAWETYIIQTEPKALKAGILANPRIPDNFRQICPVKLEFANGMLSLLEQQSAKSKWQYLQTCFDVLCDLAEAIEQAQAQDIDTEPRQARKAHRRPKQPLRSRSS